MEVILGSLYIAEFRGKFLNFPKYRLEMIISPIICLVPYDGLFYFVLGSLSYQIYHRYYVDRPERDELIRKLAEANVKIILLESDVEFYSQRNVNK